jgi:hypothetical protein
MTIRSLAALLALATAASCAPPVSAHAPGAPIRRDRASTDRAVRAALDSFIVDFNALDSARFAARWLPTASAILPFADTPERLDGREAVQGRFRAYFAQVRRERSGPPFLFMVLRDVRIELLADDVALVSYLFDASGRAQRRSLVMVAGPDARWRIAHMHGSSAAAAP